MIYYSKFKSPLGELLLVSEKDKLIGLYVDTEVEDIKILAHKYNKELVEKDNLNIFEKTKDWLRRYFNGEVVHAKELDLEIKNNILGTTFEKYVWEYIYEIQYGEITTYKAIANKIKRKLNKENMAAQAVGRAVGKNPIGIINPCHRVVGSKGDLVGFASGLDNKRFLLNIEKLNEKEILKQIENLNNQK